MTRLVGALPCRDVAAFWRPFVRRRAGLVAPLSVPRVGQRLCVRRLAVVERPLLPDAPEPSGTQQRGLRVSTPHGWLESAV
jgi:hypothetical protein